MNRDEQKSRQKEKPPYRWENQNIFAPQDTKGGGTWAAINVAGIIACLLNGYRSKDKTSNMHRSRGAIIPFVLRADDPFEAANRLNAENYASFILYIVNSEKAREYSWDGHAFNSRELDEVDWHFFTSSSYLQDEVKESRYSDFQDWIKQDTPFLGAAPTVHIGKNHADAAYNVLMNRDDACTKSMTQFEISKDQKMLRYWENPHEDHNLYEEFAV